MEEREQVVVALEEQLAELRDFVAGLDEAGWACASRCEGWTVCDVVLHLAQTNEMAIGSARGTFAETVGWLARGLPAAGSVDDGAGALVARERGRPAGEVLDRWERSASEMIAALTQGPLSRRVQWVAGDLAARTLVTTRLAETWIHTGDIAFGLHRELAPTPRLEHIARLAWRTLPHAFARDGRQLAGPVAFDLRGPHGEAWCFTPDEPAVTTITGDAVELCLVAARRVPASATSLGGTGPDAAGVLALVRTWA